MSELAIRDDQAFFDEQQQAALRQMGLGDAPRADVAVFFHQAQRSGLDPFSRQIYMIGRRSKQGNEWVTKYTHQTSIDGFRIIRDRKGTYRGHVEQWCGSDGVWVDVWLKSEPPVAARVLLHIEGFAQPVPGVALWSEFAPMRNGEPSGMWGKMPALMLAKCAEALALRKAFPNDLSGLYTAEEMAQAGAPAAPAVAAAAQAAPAPEPMYPVRGGELVPKAEYLGIVMEAIAGADMPFLKRLYAEVEGHSLLQEPVDRSGTRLEQLLWQRRRALEAAPAEDAPADAAASPAEKAAAKQIALDGSDQ